MDRVTPLLVLLALGMIVPFATAQDLGAAVDKANGEADAALADPVTYVQHETSPPGLEEERAWTLEFACATARDVAQAAGSPTPELEPCQPGPNVDAGPAPTEEPVGEVVPITDDAVGEAVDLSNKAVGAVDGILRDPPSALDRLAAFIAEALAAVGRIVDDLLGALGSVQDGVSDVALEFAGAAATAMTALGSTFPASVTVVGDATMQVDAAIVQLETKAVQGVTSAASMLGATVSGAVSSAADTVGESIGAVHDWFVDLTRGSDGKVPDATQRADDVTKSAGDTLRPVRDLVDGTLAK